MPDAGQRPAGISRHRPDQPTRKIYTSPPETWEAADPKLRNSRGGANVQDLARPARPAKIWPVADRAAACVAALPSMTVIDGGAALAMRSLVKVFDGLVAVDGVDLDVPAG